MPKLTLMLEDKTIRVYDLDRSAIRIGRLRGMDIVIDSAAVSRQQAEICREGNAWVIRDLGSANGTYINGQLLTNDRPLSPGDEIAIGQYSLVFEHGGP